MSLEIGDNVELTEPVVLMNWFGGILMSGLRGVAVKIVEDMTAVEFYDDLHVWIKTSNLRKIES